MAISHAFSNAVADATGTITVWNGATTASVAASAVVKPSDWNSVHNMGYTLAGNTTNASTVSGTDVVFRGAGGVVLAGSNSSLVISGNAATVNFYEPFPMGNNTSYSSYGQNTLYFQGFHTPLNVSMTAIEQTISVNNASSSVSHSVGETFSYAMYQQGTGASTSQLTLLGSSSYIMQASFSSNLSGGVTIGNAATSFTSSSAGTAFITAFTGLKELQVPFNTVLPNNALVYLAHGHSTTSTGGTGALRVSYLNKTNMTNVSMGFLGNSTVLASNASVINQPQMGIYTVTSGAFPSTVALSQLSINSGNQMYVNLEA